MKYQSFSNVTVKVLRGFASAYEQEFALTLRIGYSKQSKEEAYNETIIYA
jgi:hypothetical protein